MNHNFKYSVSYLHGEQNRASTAIQCVNQLQHLENVMNDIFNDILTRINDNSVKVKELQNRAKNAQLKIEKLKDRSNATQVFSSAVYPGEEEYKPFKSLFKEGPKLEFTLKDEKLFDPPEYDSSSLKEKLDFFHVNDHRRHSPSKTGNKKAGLGRLPPHLTSVSSLLLYNTTHNPYNEYMLLDPLGVVSGTRGETKVDSDINVNIPEAPISIEKGDQTLLIGKDEFQYLPDLTDLPELDLPLELPSLPGIANDLSYDVDEAPSIAPSIGIADLPIFEPVSLANQFESLPVFSSPESGLNLQTGDSSTLSIKEPQRSSTHESSSPQVSSPPPPPPPPPTSDIPPPPPPPPPLLPFQSPSQYEGEEDQIDQIKSSPPKPESIPVDVASDSRLNLMKAIQEAGGAGKAKLRKVGGKKKEELPIKPHTGGGGDLMADLFAKLSQRRKGISGNASLSKKLEGKFHEERELSKESNTGTQSVMQKVSAIIPLPPMANDTTDSEGQRSDEDWE